MATVVPIDQPISSSGIFVDMKRIPPPPSVPGTEPELKPDPEPQPGSEPDVIPPVTPEPESNPDLVPLTPAPAPI
jgi:hypothetical protein